MALTIPKRYSTLKTMGIDLFKREIFGMQLDKSNYSVLIDKIVHLFSNTFGADMFLVKKQEAFEQMGYFKIQYRYLPSDYDIVFESERNVFCIDIYDGEGAKNSLYRINKFENETVPENIESAVKILKTVLQKNDFCFYITQKGKLYEKKNQQYRRVKDLTELMGR